MTLAGWLDSRAPAPPPALRARIEVALGASLGLDASEAFDACLTAGTSVMESLLRQNATTRDSAIDLLAADALVTYAFEAASERPADLADRAAEAMTRIAAVGAKAVRA